jgi:hypothetical protein
MNSHVYFYKKILNNHVNNRSQELKLLDPSPSTAQPDNFQELDNRLLDK